MFFVFLNKEDSLYIFLLSEEVNVACRGINGSPVVDHTDFD